jgi:hypothetical protein
MLLPNFSGDKALGVTSLTLQVAATKVIERQQRRQVWGNSVDFAMSETSPQLPHASDPS